MSHGRGVVKIAVAVPPASRLAIYGLSREDWIKLYEAQEGRCILCTRSFTPKRVPHVDHDHATGEVRGLLDGNCNWLLGTLHHARDWCFRVYEYLTEPFSRSVFDVPRMHMNAPPPEQPRQRPIEFGGAVIPDIAGRDIGRKR